MWQDSLYWEILNYTTKTFFKCSTVAVTILLGLEENEKCFEFLEALVKRGLFLGSLGHSIDICDLKRIVDYFNQKDPWS